MLCSFDRYFVPRGLVCGGRGALEYTVEYSMPCLSPGVVLGTGGGGGDTDGMHVCSDWFSASIGCEGTRGRKEGKMEGEAAERGRNSSLRPNVHVSSDLCIVCARMDVIPVTW